MGRHLIIPDIHQDLVFLGDVLEREPLDGFDRIVLLGDYFDAYRPECDSVGAAVLTARFLTELREACGPKLHMLWGNHDLPYLEFGGRAGVADMRPAPAPEGGYRERVAGINALWGEGVWASLELAVICDGWLLSHAGIHPRLWPADPDPEAALDRLRTEWDRAVDGLPDSFEHPLFQAGPARAGEGAVGGPVWLDWDREFRDRLPLPQIVGHSRDTDPRRRGRSWCIDCGQSAYAILEDGAIEVRRL